MEPILTLEMRTGVSPALLAFTGMLALSSAELEGLVDHELSANPALERTDMPACPFCGSCDSSYCCETRRTSRRIAGEPGGADGRGGGGGRGGDGGGGRGGGGGGGGERPGPAEWAAPRTGAEELLDEIRWSMTADDAALASYLIGSLDDRGFLPGGPEQVAADLGIHVSRVNQALDSIRQLGPPAIGARDVRESLLLQLGVLNSADPLCELARAIADRYLEPLARGRLDAIAAGLGSSRDEIAAAVLYIRRYCAPSPAPGLRSPPAAARLPAVPDVAITLGGHENGGLRVEMLEPARLALRIHPGYARLAARCDERAAQQHAAGLVRQGASFISRLNERFRTIQRVVEYTAGRQRAFVLRGPQYLQPLAQAEVARELGVHESTVSRAVAGKYMMLPSRAVVPVQDFFRSAIAPHDVLRQLIAAEKRPLTDTELAQRLQARGFLVARRTVAKYRHALGIAAAPLRESALASAAK
jgi:RNA polymerase sigma-54 factor